MQNIKAPLITITTTYAIGFFDGALSLGFSDGVYTLLGLITLGALVWAWVVYWQRVID